LLISGFVLTTVWVQAQYSRHIIRFTDKNGTGFELNNPTAFLSPASVSRRTKYNIALDSTDLPVASSYVEAVSAAGNVRILSVSKWLNQVLIQTTDAEALNRISQFPFVRSAAPTAERIQGPMAPFRKFDLEKVEANTVSQQRAQAFENIIDYGSSFQQVHIHEGEFLHNRGFTGKGITIAVLDAGYFNYETIGAFDSLRLKGRLLGAWDFVEGESNVNEDDPHGMYCLSIMAANLPGRFVGTAPSAGYYLFRSEDAFSEFPVEEHNWVVAAERADSLGVDMISSSLGYTVFDDPVFNHSYSDMDGNTTMVTKGADLAAKKGILVCNSAGNAGSSSWKYLVAPADGDSVLAVGATDVNGQVAGFSSYGPSADGRVKPDVASVGAGTFLIATNGEVASGDGTSFSNPNIAGLIACLWQAFPEFNNMEIIDAVRRSSSRSGSPDDRVGYGIPNMRRAYQYLLEKRFEDVLQEDWVKAFPNPVQSNLTVLVKTQEEGTVEYQLTDMNGRLLRRGSVSSEKDLLITLNIPGLEQLPRGIYNLTIRNGNAKKTVRLMR
jgi:subtilisin family serine protease